MGIGKNILQGVRDLFGKSTSNQTPNNLDIIQFNSATNQWEVVSAVVGQAVQTSSNVGTGEGVALSRIGDDLPFRSLVQNAEIILTGSADEIAFSVGIIAQSKITNLVSDLLLKEDKINKGAISGYAGLDGTALLFLANIPFLPISQITGLQTALDTKIETLTNVGTGSEIAKPKVLQNVDLRKIKAGTGITVNQLTDEIEIVNSQPPPILPTKATFVMGYHADKNWKIIPNYGAMFTGKADEAIEAEAQGFFNFAYTVVEITLFVSNNIDILGGNTITLKKNSIALPATTLTIPALTTGKFSVSISESFASADEIHEEHILNVLGNNNDIKNVSYYLQCESALT
jgi:hypothetical protein